MSRRSLTISNIEYSLYYDLNGLLQESYGCISGSQQHDNDKTVIHKIDSDNSILNNYKKPHSVILKSLNIIRDRIDDALNCDYRYEIGIKNRRIDKRFFEADHGHDNSKDEYLFIYFIYNKNLDMLCTQTILKNSLSIVNINSILSIINDDCNYLLHKKKIIDNFYLYDLVFNSYAAGTFFHEVIGHFLEADNYDFSKISNKKQLCPHDINIYENYKNTIQKDDLGYKIEQSIHLIKDGSVNHLLSSGNYQTEEFDKIPIPRMRSMFISHSKNKEIIITEKSIVIDDILCAECNYYTGDVSLIINKARICSQTETHYINPFTIMFNVVNFDKFPIIMNNRMEEHRRLCGKNGSMISLNFTSPSFKLLANKYIMIQGG